MYISFKEQKKTPCKFREVTSCFGENIKLCASGICVKKRRQVVGEGSWRLLPCIHNNAFQCVGQ